MFQKLSMTPLKGSVVSFAQVVLVVALCSAAMDPEPVVETPNILIIVADDVGVDQLASYGLGSDLSFTPVLDSLALGRRSVRERMVEPGLLHDTRDDLDGAVLLPDGNGVRPRFEFRFRDRRQ